MAIGHHQRVFKHYSASGGAEASEAGKLSKRNRIMC